MAFTCKHHLERHIRILHTNECKHKCTECSAVFTKKQSLNKHLTFDHGKKKPQICALCNKDFFTVGQLDLHECEEFREIDQGEERRGRRLRKELGFHSGGSSSNANSRNG
jgi:hypothetical protein